MARKRLPLFHRLGFQLGSMVTLVILITLGGAGWRVLDTQQDNLTREMTLRMLSETRSLALAAVAPLLRTDPELGLNPLVERAIDADPDLQDLVVLDADGLIQGHRNLLEIGRPRELPTFEEMIATPSSSAARAGLVDELVVVVQPIMRGEQRVGTLLAEVSTARVERVVDEARREILMISGVFVAALLLASLALVNWHLRPLGALQRGVERIGSGDLEFRLSRPARNELGELSERVNEMADGLARAQHRRIKQERMERELELARDLQNLLLPRNAVAPDSYGLKTHYTPAFEVSGDYFDALPLPNDKLAVITADVSGKGVPGLVVMAMLRIVLHGLVHSHDDPARIMRATARLLDGTMRPGMFVTCIVGVLDPRTHTLRYASAGHCPPVVWRAGEAHELPAGGKPLGLFPPTEFVASLATHEVSLAPDDVLLLYTDGLVESMNESGSQLGLQEVFEVLSGSKAFDAEELVHALVEREERHRGSATPSDDLTLIALQRIRQPQGRPVGVTA